MVIHITFPQRYNKFIHNRKNGLNGSFYRVIKLCSIPYHAKSTDCHASLNLIDARSGCLVTFCFQPGGSVVVIKEKDKESIEDEFLLHFQGALYHGYDHKM